MILKKNSYLGVEKEFIPYRGGEITMLDTDCKFEIGDIVVLKSGGGPMTVESISDNNRIRCVWYDLGTMKYTRVDFASPLLLKKSDLTS